MVLKSEKEKKFHLQFQFSTFPFTIFPSFLLNFQPFTLFSSPLFSRKVGRNFPVRSLSGALYPLPSPSACYATATGVMKLQANRKFCYTLTHYRKVDVNHHHHSAIYLLDGSFSSIQGAALHVFLIVHYSCNQDVRCSVRSCNRMGRIHLCRLPC